MTAKQTQDLRRLVDEARRVLLADVAAWTKERDRIDGAITNAERNILHYEEIVRLLESP